MKNTLTRFRCLFPVSFPIPIIFALLLNAMLGQKYKKNNQTVTYVPILFPGSYSGSDFPGCWITIMAFMAACTAFYQSSSAEYSFQKGLFKHISCGPVCSVYRLQRYYLCAALSGVDQSLHEAAMIVGSRSRACDMTDVGDSASASIVLVLAVGNIMNDKVMKSTADAKMTRTLITVRLFPRMYIRWALPAELLILIISSHWHVQLSH